MANIYKSIFVAGQKLNLKISSSSPHHSTSLLFKFIYIIKKGHNSELSQLKDYLELICINNLIIHAMKKYGLKW